MDRLAESDRKDVEELLRNKKKEDCMTKFGFQIDIMITFL